MTTITNSSNNKPWIGNLISKIAVYFFKCPDFNKTRKYMWGKNKSVETVPKEAQN